jgi:hypothetical protein
LLSQEKRTISVKAGTVVPLEAMYNVRASKVHYGDFIDFKVSRDVIVDDMVAIPAGTIAKGTVYEAKRSSWFGTKGRLGIRMRSLFLPNGEELFFAYSDIYITGKNLTPISVIVFLCVYYPFICGTKAEMKAGYSFDATIASTTEIVIE